MDEKPEDYSQEDDAGLNLIDFYVLPHYLTAPFKKVTETYLKAFEQKEIDRTNRMIISYVKQEAEKANKNRNILFNTL